MSLKKVLGKMTFCAMLAASVAGVAVPARADCRNDIRKAEANLDKAIRKHGEHSPQAEERRRQLEEVRRRCHWEEHH
jgi:hypothetical protein